MELTSWNLPGSDDQPIIGTTHLPDTSPIGSVLIAHGFKGYKDYGFFPRLALRLAEAGLIAHRFNFSHSGMTEKIDTFERPDLFEHDTWSRQIDDLLTVARALRDDRLPGKGGDLPTGWFGHSRGGVTVLNAAARATRDAAHDALKPDAIVTASAPASACRLSGEQIDLLKRDGRLTSPSGRTGQALHVGIDWLTDIEQAATQSPNPLDPCQSIAALTCPVLIIHGQDDPTVPIADAHQLKQAARPDTHLHVIPHTQHTYNCPNPLPDDQPEPEPTLNMIKITTDYFRDHLTA